MYRHKCRYASSSARVKRPVMRWMVSNTLLLNDRSVPTMSSWLMGSPYCAASHVPRPRMPKRTRVCKKRTRRTDFHPDRPGLSPSGSSKQSTTISNVSLSLRHVLSYFCVVMYAVASNTLTILGALNPPMSEKYRSPNAAGPGCFKKHSWPS